LNVASEAFKDISNSTSDTGTEGVGRWVVGCTAPQEKTEWKISDSMLQAYVAMRGPVSGPYLAPRNDLRAWIDHCGRNMVPLNIMENTGSCTKYVKSFAQGYAREKNAPIELTSNRLVQLWETLMHEFPVVDFGVEHPQTYTVPRVQYGHLENLQKPSAKYDTPGNASEEGLFEELTRKEMLPKRDFSKSSLENLGRTVLNRRLMTVCNCCCPGANIYSLMNS
jgi:hypothetical protein